MTVQGVACVVPSKSSLVGALGPTRFLLTSVEELFVLDSETGEVSLRRTIPGLRGATLHGAWLVAHAKAGPVLLPADLSAEPEGWPAPNFDLAAILGSVALFVGHGERLLFDLATRTELARAKNDVGWASSHAGLFLGTRARTREIVAMRPTGAIAWSTKPFARKLDDLGHPYGFGDEVHVRADTVDGPWVARLAMKDGAAIASRPAASGFGGWLPDHGEAVERLAVTFAGRSALPIPSGIVFAQGDQLIVVRPGGVARIGAPYLTDLRACGEVAAGITSDPNRTELVVVPLPAEGEHDLELAPRGEEAEVTDAVGTVTFAGAAAPIVIVQHPTYGRVNLTRESSAPPPPVGANVVLDGVEQLPGGVVRVGRWWIAGGRAPRETRRCALGPPAMASAEPPSYTTQLAAELVSRAAGAEGIAVPADVSRFLALVDGDPGFRRALETLGLHFEEPELGSVEDLEVDDFVAVWSNGYGDGFGGITPDGLAYLRPGEEPTPIGSLAAYVRDAARDSDSEASAERVLAVLDREGL